MKFRIIEKEKKLGLKKEAEHNDITKGDPKLIEKIVMVHLKENPNYYSKLEKIEKD